MLWGSQVRADVTPRLVVIEGNWTARPAAAAVARLSGSIAQVLGPVAAVLAGAIAGGPRILSRIGVGAVAGLVVLPVAMLASRWLALLGDLLSIGVLFPEVRPRRSLMAWLVALPRRAKKLALEAPPGESLGRAARRLMVAAHIQDNRVGGGRALRIAHLADLAAERLNLAASERSALQWASLLSDLGMVEVPEGVRDRSGELNTEESEKVEGHVAASLRLAAPLGPWLGTWLDAIEDHHERWSGTGYPNGAVGEEIHIGARILAVADALDALTSSGRNARPLTIGPALDEIRRHKPGRFDPEVVEAFAALLRLRPSLVIGDADRRRRLWLASWWYRRQVSIGVASLAILLGSIFFISRFDRPEVAVAGIVVTPTTDATALPTIVPKPTTPTTVPRTAPTTVVPLETTTITFLPAELFTPVDDRVTTVEDTPVVISVLGNDIDPDNFIDPASLQIVASPRQGSATVITNGRIRYTPKADFNGTDSLRYGICDRDLRCAEAGVIIAVTAVNDPPRVGTISLVTLEDTAKSFSLAAADLDSKLVACALTLTPAHGSAFVAADCSTGSYTPAANYAGTDRFEYKVGGGGLSTKGIVEVTVQAVNDPPLARVASLIVAEGQSRAFTPVIVDPDGPAPQCRIGSPPASGSAQISVNCSSGTYTPSSGFSGSDGFTYVVSDGSLESSGSVTVTVTTVALVNNPPSASSVSITTLEDTAKAWTPVVSDPEGGSLACTIITPPANGSVTVAAGCGSGTYTPNPNFNGTNTFTYRVCDPATACDSAVVTVTVTPVNDLPVASSVSITTLEDTAKTWTPTVSDVDGGSLACTILTAPANGSATVAGGCASGTYTPAANFSGSNSFTYRTCDIAGGCASATVSITVTAVNDPPVAGSVSITTPEDTATAWTPVVSDVEGGALTCSIRTAPANGSATVAAGCASGTYTPNLNFSGSNTFRYRVCDAAGACDNANVSVTVTAVNDPPTAGNVMVTASEDGPSVGWTPAVADPDTASRSCLIVSAPANGSASVTNNCSSGSYTPKPNFSGSDTFTYQVSDGTSTAIGTVSVTVTAVNDPPTAGNVAITASEDGPSVGWTPAVADPDTASLTCSILSAPANGSAEVISSCSSGSYTPNAAFSGTDTFTYQVSDGTSTATGTVSVTVTAVNHPPLAVNDSASTVVDAAVTISVLSNDSDPDGDLLTVISSSQGANGAVSCSASSCTYTPNTGFTGSDSFTYTISDGTATSTATVNVTVA